MSSSPLQVLLLCDFHSGTASTILEHIHAFPKFSRHRIHVFSNRGDLPKWLNLRRFDAVVIHYSLVACYDSYISPSARTRIRDFTGFKAAFIQDDYRWINDTLNAFAYMGINALFPLASPDIMDAVYPSSKLPGVRRETVLTGYIPEELPKLEVPRFSERPIDVGYRARKLPAWMGAHTLQKWQIAERFMNDAARYGLRTDISCREEDRVYGAAWINFVKNCKAMLGTESGTSVCDFTGDIQRNVEGHLQKYPDATFEELQQLYFADVDGKIVMNVISPRCFEAASLRTLMVFYEGNYSGVLEPWRHYVPLKADHSNVDEVVGILRDPRLAEPIIQRAYREVALNPKYSYHAMVRLVDRVIDEEFKPDMRAHGDPYTSPEFEWWRERENACALVPRCRLKFYPEHDLDKAVDGPPDRNYAAAVEGQPLPQSFEVTLGARSAVCLVRLEWESATNSPADFMVQLLRGKKAVAEHRIRGNTSSGTELEFENALADRVQVVVYAYNGQQRLLLRLIEVFSGSPPWVPSVPKIHRRLWHLLPSGVRQRLRPWVAPLARFL